MHMQVRVADQILVALASDRRRALAPKRGEVRRGKQEICANYVAANTSTLHAYHPNNNDDTGDT